MATISRSVNTSPYYGVQLRSFAIKALVSLFALLVLVFYLLPMGNMLSASVRSQSQLSQTQNDSILPMSPASFNYQGQDYPIYKVPLDSGVKDMALVKKAREKSQFVDPANPAAVPVEWTGNWRTLEPVQYLSFRWANFSEAWDLLNFPLLFRNPLFIALADIVGTLL